MQWLYYCIIDIAILRNQHFNNYSFISVVRDTSNAEMIAIYLIVVRAGSNRNYCFLMLYAWSRYGDLQSRCVTVHLPVMPFAYTKLDGIDRKLRSRCEARRVSFLRMRHV